MTNDQIDTMLAERLFGARRGPVGGGDYPKYSIDDDGTVWRFSAPRVGGVQWSPTGCPAHTAEAETELCNLASYMGRIVPHVVLTADGRTTQGVCLKEKYLLALMRQVGIPEVATTTMGENNWVDHRFRTDELLAIAAATPDQRAGAMVEVLGRAS